MSEAEEIRNEMITRVYEVNHLVCSASPGIRDKQSKKESASALKISSLALWFQLSDEYAGDQGVKHKTQVDNIAGQCFKTMFKDTGSKLHCWKHCRIWKPTQTHVHLLEDPPIVGKPWIYHGDLLIGQQLSIFEQRIFSA